MIHLDTHVLAWLQAGDLGRLPPDLRRLLERVPLRVSPAVGPELEYLHAIGHLAGGPAEVLEAMRSRLDLRISVAARAWSLRWTRDPFDRLVAATALVEDLPLDTADERMRSAYAVATWG